MRGPKPPPIDLSEADREALEALVRRRRTGQQLALRARMILAAADGLNNAQIGRRLGVEADTVRRWPGRWLRLPAVERAELSVAERLSDVPRPGAPPRITAEQVCRVVALACEAPRASGRPISQWTGREIADELVRRSIVEGISPRHAGRLLKRGISSRQNLVVGAIGNDARSKGGPALLQPPDDRVQALPINHRTPRPLRVAGSPPPGKCPAGAG